MCYKNSRKLIREVNETHEQGIASDESKSALQNYYEQFVNVALNNTLTVFVGLTALLFLLGGLTEATSTFSADIGSVGRTILNIIPLIASGFLLYLNLMRDEARESTIIKEFVSTFFYASFLWFLGFIFVEFQITNFELSTLRVFLLLVILLGTLLCFYRNATGVMLLNIPLIFLYTYFPDSLSNLMALYDFSFFGAMSFQPGSWYFISMLLFCTLFLHFWLNVDTLSKKQAFKPVIIGWITSILGYIFFVNVIPGNLLLFSSLYILGLYIFGKMYFDQNVNWYARPMQTTALVLSIMLLLGLSSSVGFRSAMLQSSFYGIEGFKNAPYDFWIFLGLLLIVGVSLFYFYVKPIYLDGEEQFNPIIITLPFFILFLMLIALLEWETFPVILVNLYAIGLSVYLMVNGSQEKYHSMYLLGLAFLTSLLYARYFDMDVHWILRSLFFIVVGAAFFGIAFTLKDRTEGHEEP